jgi:ribosomal protein L22
VARKTRIGASVKKLKQVVKQVAGMSVTQAIRQLEVNQRKCSRDVLKCVKMARANAKHLHVSEENLVLAEMIIGAAPPRKNIQFHAKGRIGEWFQRYSHLTVVVKPLAAMKGRRAKEQLQRIQINQQFKDWKRGIIPKVAPETTQAGANVE